MSDRPAPLSVKDTPIEQPDQSLLARTSRMIPLAVLLLVLLLTVATAATIARFVRDQQQARFEREATAHTFALKNRIGDYENLLRATRAYWMSNQDMVLPSVFDDFVSRLDLTRRYPGVTAVGFAAWIPAADTADVEAGIRAGAGSEYRINPPTSTQAMRAPVVTLSPLNNATQAAWGFDLYSDPDRRAALDLARLNNTVQATGRVNLQRTPGGPPNLGFLLILPVWNGMQPTDDEQVQDGGGGTRTLAGFIYLVASSDEFLAQLDEGGIPTGLSINTKLAGQRLEGLPLPDTLSFRSDTKLTLAGQPWTLNYGASTGFGRDLAANLPLLTLLAGLLVAGLAFRLTHVQVQSRESTERINRRLTLVQARQARDRAEFEAIFQAMQDAAAFTDDTGRVRLVNRALTEQFGLDSAALIGEPLARLHVDRRLEGRTTFQAITTPYQRADGSVFSGEAQRSEVVDGRGEQLGLLEVIRDVTDRVQAERAVQAGERRYRGVLDAIPHILWASSPAGNVTYVNAQHHERLSEGSVREAVLPADLLTYDNMWHSAYEISDRAQSEVRVRVGESYRWFVVRVAPILDERGSVAEWVASATDIHDRLEAERLAQRSEERYRGVLEGMPQIVWLTDPAGLPTYFNRRWDEYVGEERANTGLLNLLHPDDRGEYQQRWAAAVQATRPFEAEHRLLGADGWYRTFVTRGLPVHDAQGQVIEWVGTSTDVDDSVYAETASRLIADVSEQLSARAEDPLAARAGHYHAALELLTGRLAESAALWSAPPELAVLAASRTGVVWQAAHMQAAATAAVRRVAELEEPLIIPSHPLLHAVNATGALLFPLMGRDGTLRGILALTYRQALTDRDQELAQELAKRFATALDNDALRVRAISAQQDLQALNQSLEERVHRRTLELEDANRELEAFSYSVSHDLRTPLRHIVGFGDLLKKDAGEGLGPKSQRYLAVMTDAANRMSHLIDDLLEFSRMGRQELRSGPVPLGPLLDTVWNTLEPDRQGREIALSVGPLPTVPGDAALLTQVFVNLLSNAIKYTRHQPDAQIRVSAEWPLPSDSMPTLTQPGRVNLQKAAQNHAIITVQDNGVGFDGRYADKLFGVFQRLHRAEEFEGTGIGLANVRRVVMRHGGSVQAQSVPGEGATFQVILPLQSSQT
ncbi:PAS domain S-box protein [Deinococcus sp. QL22]|uniref:PAS domain S-box protein n=1 Tax=Deinococcus sp. QL22 TaxID=2939437 RepID=UPI002017142D|nr:PAS domain S-box protein [Deinococcus sp. QL22]UQN05903.1 PAS domain S-box protein [Deinococcus sp. QL22]